MKKAFLLVVILFISVISTACINNLAVQELNNKAKESLNKGDFETAISRLKSSIDLDGTAFETHYNLGIAYTQAEKYPEAIETFQNATKLKPSFADTYYSLAVAQENFAKGIMDGSIKEKASKNDNNDEAKNDEASGADVKLTKEENAQIARLLNDSVASYSTYLKKGRDIEDKKDVEEKIEYLKTQSLKYSPQQQ